MPKETPVPEERADVTTHLRRRSVLSSLVVLLVSCACLLAAGPAAAAETNTYTEGTADHGFSVGHLDTGWVWDQGAADETLTLTLDELAPFSAPAMTSTQITGPFSLGGRPVDKVGFVRFVLHVDIAVDTGFEPIPVVSYTSRPGGTDFQDANVARRSPGVIEFEPRLTSYGQLPGGPQLTYRLSFKVPSGGAVGTVTVHDFTLVYGEYVEPPKDDGDGGKDDGGKNDGGSKNSDPKAKPSGIAYMGGSGDGSGSGSGGSGTGSGGSATGSGQGGGGVRVGEGIGSISTDAPSVSPPRATGGDTVTGYPLRLEDVAGGGGEPGGGAGGGAASTGTGGGRAGSSLSWKDLVWFAAALAATTPFAFAALDRRRVRQRLRQLVEETPDGPAPRVTAPA